MTKKPYNHCREDCRFIKDGACDYRNQHIPTIAVDFDRVLFEHESWQGHEHIGAPIKGAKEALEKFRGMGFRIMIWTTRAQKEIIAEACNAAGIPFDYINENPNQPPEINPSKPVADYYIDDRALHFISWEQTVIEIIHREKHDGYYPIAPKEDVEAAFRAGQYAERDQHGIVKCQHIRKVTEKCGHPERLCIKSEKGCLHLRKKGECPQGHGPDPIDELREIVCRLYDEGMNNPLVIFDAAANEYRRKTG